jgi:kynurenine 3-monooxygenase
VGLADEVRAAAVPMRGRMLHDVAGKQLFQPYGTRPYEYSNSVSRSGLNELLIEAADRFDGVTLHFERRTMGADLDDPALLLENPTGDDPERAKGDLILGADGAFSKVRASMQRRPRFDFSQSYLEHGYKELTIPPGPDGGFRMEPEALHIWPRGGRMMIALPNKDGSFTCTLFWPYGGPDGFEAIRDEQDLMDRFERDYPDAIPMMPDLEWEFFENPTSPLVTVRCRPWTWGGRVALLGDACHAIVPFYGQGANAAFEDCSMLAECLAETDAWGDAIERYEARRIAHANALADLALENFIEMRDAVNSPLFRAKKYLGQAAHKAFPDLFVPLYSMVTFSRIPYAEAVRRSRLQNAVAGGVAAAGGLLALAGLARLFRGRSR